MGYDHFALLCIHDTKNDNKEFDTEFIKYIEKIASKNKFYNEPMFGYVHHLSSGSIGDEWHKNCDNIINNIWIRYPKFIFDVYLSEFDGTSLYKITYKKDDSKIITTLDVSIKNDNSIKIMHNLTSLYHDNNLSCYFNDNYPYEFEC